MKVLFIGGTGNISTSVSRLCVKNGIELFILNRGNRKVEIDGVQTLHADFNNPDEMSSALKGHYWDCVVNWIIFTPEQQKRDIELYKGKTNQYIFISSASAYQKPPVHPIITESTPLSNPYWQYSRDKITCEEMLTKAYREEGFPITIVRPSHTYDTVIPLPFGAWNEYTVPDRMKRGEKVIVHGDGTSLWTLTHGDDFAVGFAGLIGHQQAIGHAFHITSDEVLTWNQIYEATAAALGVKANLVHIPSDYLVKHDADMMGTLIGDKSYSVIFDNTKIKTFVPAFNAVIPYSQGIKRTIEWFEADPKRKVINKEHNAWTDKIIKAYDSITP